MIYSSFLFVNDERADHSSDTTLKGQQRFELIRRFPSRPTKHSPAAEFSSIAAPSPLSPTRPSSRPPAQSATKFGSPRRSQKKGHAKGISEQRTFVPVDRESALRLLPRLLKTELPPPTATRKRSPKGTLREHIRALEESTLLDPTMASLLREIETEESHLPTEESVRRSPPGSPTERVGHGGGSTSPLEVANHRFALATHSAYAGIPTHRKCACCNTPPEMCKHRSPAPVHHYTPHPPAPQKPSEGPPAPQTQTYTVGVGTTASSATNVGVATESYQYEDYDRHLIKLEYETANRVTMLSIRKCEHDEANVRMDLQDQFMEEVKAFFAMLRSAWLKLCECHRQLLELGGLEERARSAIAADERRSWGSLEKDMMFILSLTTIVETESKRRAQLYLTAEFSREKLLDNIVEFRKYLLMLRERFRDCREQEAHQRRQLDTQVEQDFKTIVLRWNQELEILIRAFLQSSAQAEVNGRAAVEQRQREEWAVICSRHAFLIASHTQCKALMSTEKSDRQQIIYTELDQRSALIVRYGHLIHLLNAEMKELLLQERDWRREMVQEEDRRRVQLEDWVDFMVAGCFIAEEEKPFRLAIRKLQQREWDKIANQGAVEYRHAFHLHYMRRHIVDTQRSERERIEMLERSARESYKATFLSLQAHQELWKSRLSMCHIEGCPFSKTGDCPFHARDDVMHVAKVGLSNDSVYRNKLESTGPLGELKWK